MAETLEFTGFLSSESSESVQWRWILFRDVGKTVSFFETIFPDFSEFEKMNILVR